MYLQMTGLVTLTGLWFMGCFAAAFSKYPTPSRDYAHPPDIYTPNFSSGSISPAPVLAYTKVKTPFYSYQFYAYSPTLPEGSPPFLDSSLGDSVYAPGYASSMSPYNSFQLPIPKEYLNVPEDSFENDYFPTKYNPQDSFYPYPLEASFDAAQPYAPSFNNYPVAPSLDNPKPLSYFNYWRTLVPPNVIGGGNKQGNVPQSVFQDSSQPPLFIPKAESPFSEDNLPGYVPKITPDNTNTPDTINGVYQFGITPQNTFQDHSYGPPIHTTLVPPSYDGQKPPVESNSIPLVLASNSPNIIRGEEQTGIVPKNIVLDHVSSKPQAPPYNGYIPPTYKPRIPNLIPATSPNIIRGESVPRTILQDSTLAPASTDLGSDFTPGQLGPTVTDRPLEDYGGYTTLPPLFHQSKTIPSVFSSQGPEDSVSRHPHVFEAPGHQHPHRR